jgi:D-alanyl-D-alanine carboxypeptidase
MKRKLTWTIGVVVVFGALSTATFAATTPQETLRRQTESLLPAGIPGAVLIVERPGAVTRIAAGTDLGASHRPMLVDDRFRVGSLTKTFVATVVLQLAERHRLSLEDTVERWLPGLVPNGNQITVKQLLQHTSGLFDYAADPATFQPFTTDPGHAWQPPPMSSGHDTQHGMSSGAVSR